MQLPRPVKISTDPGVNAAAMQWANLMETQLEGLLNGNLTGDNILTGSIKNSDLVQSTGVLADMPPGREIAYNEVTSPVTVSATTEGTANTLVSSTAFTFDNVTAVMIEWYFPDVSMGAGSTLTLLLHDGTNPLGVVNASGISGSTFPGWSGCRKLTPAASSLSYSIRGFRAVANCTINVGAGGSATRMPGYIRITKA